MDYRISTGLTIKNHLSWNTVKNYPKKITAENKMLHKTLFDLEDYLLNEIWQVEQSQDIGINIITTEWIRSKTRAFFHQDIDFTATDYLVSFAQSYAESLKNKSYLYKGKRIKYSPNTINKYRNVTKHLSNFEKSEGTHFRIIDVNIKFADRFLTYLLEDMDLSINTCGRYLKRLKTIIGEAEQEGLKIDPSYKAIRGFEDETVVTFLTFQEIDQIINTPMPNKRLETAKDWLIVGCFTAQRVSDFFRLRKTMLKSNGTYNYIEFKQFKTKKLVRIPIHPDLEPILAKYNDDFPPVFTENEKSFRTLLSAAVKEVCKIAGIDSLVKGRYLGKMGTYPKYKLIQNHSFRRSFASNFFGLNDWPNALIMSITGHETEKNFLKYIDKTDDYYSNQVAANFAKLKSDKVSSRNHLRLVK